MIISDIVILGFGKMPVSCAKILYENNKSIIYIIETGEHPFSPLLSFCQRYTIPYKRLNPVETTNLLDSLTRSTILFSINNNYIFPRKIINNDNVRIINFHNSLLPKYPGNGRVISTWALFNGETHHGVTWHLISPDIDAGDILCQEEFEIHESDTALNVMMRSITVGTNLFFHHWQEFMAPRITGRPQGQKHDRIYRSRDIPNNGYLDMSWDFITMSRFLRSMDYCPFSILPSPKVKIDSVIYIVKGYTIDRKNALYNKEWKFSKNYDGNIIEAVFFSQQGCITLNLVKET